MRYVDPLGLWPPGVGLTPGGPTVPTLPSVPSAPWSPPPPPGHAPSVPPAPGYVSPAASGLALGALAWQLYNAGQAGIGAMEAWNEAAENKMQGDRRAEIIRRQRNRPALRPSPTLKPSPKAVPRPRGYEGEGPAFSDCPDLKRLKCKYRYEECLDDAWANATSTKDYQERREACEKELRDCLNRI
jgi:hypothetical protein